MTMLVAATLAALVAALAGRAALVLRRRGRADLAGWDRLALVAIALGLGVAALSPPVDEAADRLLAAHMLEHLLIGDAVPALLLVGLRGPLLLFLLPAAVLGPLARCGPLRAVGAALLRPSVSLAVWAASLGIWHVPALYDRTLTSAPLHVLQHASFALGGTLVWLQLVDPLGRRALSPARRIAFAGTVFVAGQALANTLILTYWPLYPAYAGQARRLWGVSPLGDQDAAGLVMTAEQALVFGTFAAVLIRRWLRAPLALRPAAGHPFTS